MKILILALVAVALIFGFEGATIRKDLAAERRGIDAAWEQVDAALAHRAAMVPELNAAVQADLPADADTIRKIAIPAVNQAQSAMLTAHGQHEKIQANAKLDESLARLMLSVEEYPKIESSKRYGDLLEALKGAEYQIAVARRKYNEAVEHYNARIEVFPDNMVASFARLNKIDAYFQTPAI